MCKFYTNKQKQLIKSLIKNMINVNFLITQKLANI